jgi:OmpA-OmpF porin, OOP family
VPPAGRLRHPRNSGARALTQSNFDAGRQARVAAGVQPACRPAGRRRLHAVSTIPTKVDTMKKTLLSLLTVSALALSSAASAQGYVGLGVGTTNLNADCAGTSSCDKTGTGFKLFGGYKYTPNIAAELVYFDFGKAKATIPDVGGPLNGEIKTSAIGLGAAFMGPFAPEWSGVARLGIARVKGKVSASQGSRSASDSENSTQAYFGLGVGYALSKNASVDLSADFSKSKFSGESGNVRMIGIGLTYGF